MLEEFNLYNWVIEIGPGLRISIVLVCLLAFLRQNEWWSFPVLILLFIMIISAIPISIIKGNIVEILMVIPAAILSKLLAFRMISKRLKAGLSLYEGKGFDWRFPSLK
ncbi:MAG: hypothetical protein Q8K98_12670 [Bacteroidota bacterium]|nr:hypothetical protein [Bacteroidota bacterium]